MNDPQPHDARAFQPPQQQQWQEEQNQWQESQQWREPQNQWQESQQQWTGQQPLFPGQMQILEPQKDWLATVLLCQFLGAWGIHRFYTGRIVSGIFQLLTFGGFGIWTFVDLILLYTDNFTDGSNLPLTRN